MNNQVPVISHQTNIRSAQFVGNTVKTTFWVFTGDNMRFNFALYRTSIMQLPINMTNAGLVIVDVSTGGSGPSGAWDKNF